MLLLVPEFATPPPPASVGVEEQQAVAQGPATHNY